jgi:antitoxin component YwqK of YwqJK toxin-antitoxin module
MSELKLIDYKSPEKEILLSIFNYFPDMDNWITCIIENYIYNYVEEVEEVKPFMLSFYPNLKSNNENNNKNDNNKNEGDAKIDSNFTQLVQKYRMRFDEKDGEYKTYFINGVLKCEMNYKNDILEGEYKVYFTNGQLAESMMYRNGKRHGKCVRWYYNPIYHLNGESQICYENEYNNGELDYYLDTNTNEINKNNYNNNSSKKLKWTHYNS